MKISCYYARKILFLVLCFINKNSNKFSRYKVLCKIIKFSIERKICFRI